MAVLPTASESPLVYACEVWVFAMCPALRGSMVSYAGDAHFPKHSLEYSLTFWSQSQKKKKKSDAQNCVRQRGATWLFSFLQFAFVLMTLCGFHFCCILLGGI